MYLGKRLAVSDGGRSRGQGVRRLGGCSDQEGGRRRECDEQGSSHGPSGYFRVANGLHAPSCTVVSLAWES